MLSRAATLAAAVVLGGGLVACGSDDSKPTGTGTGTAADAAESTAAESAAPAGKPVVQPPGGPAPTRLKVRDLIKGRGAPAKAGDQVTVQYVGVLFENGEQFDASWDRGEPFSFQLGAGNVIRGWDQGVVGMRAGGRRELIIPPALAYGARGAPPAIGPNQTLVFVVDLVSVG